MVCKLIFILMRFWKLVFNIVIKDSTGLNKEKLSGEISILVEEEKYLLALSIGVGRFLELSMPWKFKTSTV